MKKLMRTFAFIGMSLFVMFNSSVSIKAEEMVLKSKDEETPWLSEIKPIKIDMESTGNLNLLAPGDGRYLIYEPVVRGEEGAEFKSRAYFTITSAYETDKPYELYYKDDVTYDTYYGYRVREGAEPVEVAKEYVENGYEVKEYEPVITEHIIKGDTLLEGLEFVIVAPHEAVRLPDVEVYMAIEVGYADPNLGKPTPTPTDPDDGDDTGKMKPTGDVRTIGTVALSVIATSAVFAFILFNKDKNEEDEDVNENQNEVVNDEISNDVEVEVDESSEE